MANTWLAHGYRLASAPPRPKRRANISQSSFGGWKAPRLGVGKRPARRAGPTTAGWTSGALGEGALPPVVVFGPVLCREQL